MAILDRIPLRKGLPETVLAYMAGMIEGDGTIAACRGKAGFHLDVIVTNGNLHLLSWIHTVVGGRVALRSSKGQLGSSQVYQWWLKGPDAVRFCSWLLPYLVGKRRQAELVIEAGHLKQEWPPGHPRPALIRRRLQEIADECSWCNKRAWRGEDFPYTESTEIPEQARLKLIS